MKDAFRFLVVTQQWIVQGYHIISQYKKLALVQASVGDRNVQGTRFPLIPSTPCFNAISRKREVKI